MRLFGLALTVLCFVPKSHSLKCKVANLAGKLYPECSTKGVEHCGNKECEAPDDHCYGVFRQSEDGKVFTPIHVSCWHGIFSEECHVGKCVLERKKGMFSCCCTGDFCNGNIILPKILSTDSTLNNGTDLYTTERTELLSPTQESLKENYFLYYVPASIILMVLLLGLSLYYWVKRKRYRLGEENLLAEFNAVGHPAQPCPALMLEIVHQGKLSVIWKGTYCQRLVAIKTVNKDYADLWKNEKDLFTVYKLKHESLISFVSAERRFHDNNLQYWLVTEYHENGSLLDYLLNNVLPRELFLKMLYNIINGLVYLHSTNSSKPMVAHRDLKAGNVLVKRDLSCCLGDLGLAIALPDNIDPSKDLCQAGTKRYMAPEILQGAVSFHQEAFLRADMYSMGLVIWELLSRTRIVDNEEIEDYKPPYGNVVNFNPSIDEMLKCVVENYQRPPIKQEWKTSQAFTSIIETMERCWDDDSDARLTSQCVKQRIKRLITSPPDQTFDQSALEQLKEKCIEISQESSFGSNTASMNSRSTLLISDRWRDSSSIRKDDSSSIRKEDSTSTRCSGNSARCSLHSTVSPLKLEEQSNSTTNSTFALTRLEKVV